jgi:hypothetical protein
MEGRHTASLLAPVPSSCEKGRKHAPLSLSLRERERGTACLYALSSRCVRERASVTVCLAAIREKEREVACLYACVCERRRAGVPVCHGEREREGVSVYLAGALVGQRLHRHFAATHSRAGRQAQVGTGRHRQTQRGTDTHRQTQTHTLSLRGPLSAHETQRDKEGTVCLTSTERERDRDRDREVRVCVCGQWSRSRSLSL